MFPLEEGRKTGRAGWHAPFVCVSVYLFLFNIEQLVAYVATILAFKLAVNILKEMRCRSISVATGILHSMLQRGNLSTLLVSGVVCLLKGHFTTIIGNLMVCCIYEYCTNIGVRDINQRTNFFVFNIEMLFSFIDDIRFIKKLI